MNSALRAATIGVLLLSPVAVSACSAGQITQTATQDRDKAGPMVELEQLTVRQILLAYPRDGVYDPGEDAELLAAIVNNGHEPDTLVGIEGESFQRVAVRGGTGTDGGPVTGAGAGSVGGQDGEVSIEIPPDSIVYLGENGPTVTLVGLEEKLTPAQRIDITLRFERAGEVTVPAVVATPARSLPRGEAFNFHEQPGEETTEGSNEAPGGGGHAGVPGAPPGGNEGHGGGGHGGG